MHPALPLVLLIVLVSIVTGNAVKNNLSLNLPSNEASSSASVSPGTSASPVSSTQPANTQTHTQNGNTYTSSDNGEVITMTGGYNLSTYKLTFTINIPKNGGNITGSVSGTCEGTITGTAAQPNQQGFARLEGQYSGTCKPIPTLGFKTNASGTFEGKADFNNKKAGITYTNNEPLESRGYFELFF